MTLQLLIGYLDILGLSLVFVCVHLLDNFFLTTYTKEQLDSFILLI